MTNNQSNKYSMYTASSNVLKSGLTKTAAIPAFAAAYGRFDALLNQISSKDRERMGKTSGKMAAKDEAEDALVIATLVVSSALVAMASAKGNVQLKEAAHVGESFLRRARTNEQINVARLVYDLAKANEKDLVAYGVNASMLEDLRSRIAAYDVAVKDVASGMAERTGASTAISDLFTQTDVLLKDEIDAMMQMFRVTDPEFYNDYRAARVIKDIGVRHGKNATGGLKPAVAGSPN